MPRSAKPLSREVRAAIGELVVQITWVQYMAARLVRLAGIVDNEMDMLRQGARLFSNARKAADMLMDPEVVERTRSWLREAEELEGRRHELAHSIVLYAGRPGLSMYHPKTGVFMAYRAQDIAELAARASGHADEGVYMSLFDWPPALGITDQQPNAGE